MNYLPILAASGANMIIGFLWYGPLFGKKWMSLTGMTEKDTLEGKKTMGKTYLLTYVGAVLMAYVLSYFITYSGATTLEQGVMVGFWAWLGFVATTGMHKYLFAVKKLPWSLYVLEQSYLLVVLVVNGVILVSL